MGGWAPFVPPSPALMPLPLYLTLTGTWFGGFTCSYDLLYMPSSLCCLDLKGIASISQSRWMLTELRDSMWM